MAKGALNVTFQNEAQVVKQLNSLPDGGEKALKGTISQLRTRTPAWVAQEVSSVYGIKKAEIKQSASKEGAGSVSLAGKTVDSLYLVYRGRVLTPTHFGMTPKARPAGNRRYTVKASIFKGQKKALGSKVFLGASGSEGTTHIPFQRETSARLPIQAVKTLSIPQMIDNEKVNAAIYERIETEAAKVLENQIKRFMK